MKPFLFILFIGIFLRLLLIGNTGFIADVSFWKSWSMAAADHGIVWTAHNTNINYPPGFFYVLWIMGKIYRLVADPHDFYNFWRENNFAFLLISKSFAIISDIVITVGIYWFFSQKEKLKHLFQFDVEKMTHWNIPLLLSTVFFLNPVVIIDSALWGQVESFGILFTLVAIFLILHKKPALATIIFTIGFLMKLQNIIYIPLYFLFLLRVFDLRTLVKSVAAMAGTFALVNLPFILAHDIQRALFLMIVNNDYFPWMSLNAHNLWWIVARAKGMTTSDKITVLGIANAKTVGLILFSSWYLLSTILLWIKPNAKTLFLSLSVGIFSFFLFTAESHERYSYPILVFLLLYYPFLMNNSKIKIQNSKVAGDASEGIPGDRLFIVKYLLLNKSLLYFWILYGLLTLGIFFNIHTGLVFNYPENGFRILTQITTPQLTIFNSYVLILISLALLYFVFRQISWKWVLVPVGFLFLGLIGINASYLFSPSVSLTAFKPILRSQDYLSLQVNKSVNSGGEKGWKAWNRLSNNYFFYKKGFGTHANSNIVFDLNRKFSRFSTDVGVDTEAGTNASIEFKIFGDGRELFSSGKMGRFDFPKHADVDIGGIRYLGLVVTDAGDGINDDHADWLNPVLYKE